MENNEEGIKDVDRFFFSFLMFKLGDRFEKPRELKSVESFRIVLIF